MNIIIITECWGEDNPNGGNTISFNLVNELKKMNHNVLVIHPRLFFNIENNDIPGIYQAINTFKIPYMIKEFKPDAIHILIEGTIAISTMIYLNFECNPPIPFTTSYLVRFPELFKKLGKSEKEAWKMVRYFHDSSKTILVPTKSLCNLLYKNLKYKTLKEWSHGVDFDKFNPKFKNEDLPLFKTYKKPIILCVSRCSPEKGIEDFCKIDTTGTLVFVGYGKVNYENYLREKYPKVKFIGKKMNRELSIIYSKADVFVFPSVNDTFGQTIIESIASGTPVAAFRAIGPIDIIKEGVTGYMANIGDSLNDVVNRCLNLDRDIIYKESLNWGNNKVAEKFIESLYVIPKDRWNNNKIKFNKYIIGNLIRFINIIFVIDPYIKIIIKNNIKKIISCCLFLLLIIVLRRYCFFELI
jgi:glycosyltransferase involved in cell wall biosynthesis